MNLAEIKQIAFDLMGNKRSHVGKEMGNKYYHGERVANLILVLRRYILPDDDSHDEILTVAAWFHDIMNGSDNHGKEGAEKAREVIVKYCSEYEVNEICKIISIHDERCPKPDTYSHYVKLHQDAELLDHFGTFDVWMEFIYAVQNDMSIMDVIKRFQNTRLDRDKRNREELHYEISKKIFDEKSAFVYSFGERFSVEGKGGIWNESELMKNL